MNTPSIAKSVKILRQKFTQTLGCDAVFRKHQRRYTQMRRGKIVGDCDKFVTWRKPTKCPKGLSQEEFLSLPDKLIVREIYFYIFIPGFRTEQVSLITTLLDTKTYSTLDITSLYQERWDVEVNLRHLKTTLGMDILRGKTPAMVRKEIWAFLLAYNLLRSLTFFHDSRQKKKINPQLVHHKKQNQGTHS
jgi:IS4 transposase